jgi:sulfatase modifying factor 1
LASATGTANESERNPLFMSQTITTVSIPGTDEKGNKVKLRIEVPRVEPDAPTKFPRVPKVVHANQGEKLDDAGNFTVKAPSEVSGGAYFIFEAILPPGTGVQLHRHVFQDEILYLLEGQLELELGGKIYQMEPFSLGNFVKGIPHGFWNTGQTPARAILTVIPGGLEKFFMATKTMTDPAEIVKLAAQYGMEFLGPVFIINSIGMRMVQVLPGEFMMGSPDTDTDAKPDEKPQHNVKITRPLWIGMHQVTRGQFREFVEETGYQTEYEENGLGSTGIDLETGLVTQKPVYTWTNGGFPQEDTHPVICVSYNDALHFCRWLSFKENRKYRLPTEAEWEYCCKAGTTSRYCNGDPKESMKDVGNCGDQSLTKKWIWNLDSGPFKKGQPLPPYAEPWDDGFPFTAPVGSFKPNPFGIYDMHGNVGEWCSDWYTETYYGNSPVEDPKGPAEGQVVDVSDRIPGLKRTLRVIRGGVWLDPAIGCRSADRWTHRRHPVDSAADIGFRVVLEQ